MKKMVLVADSSFVIETIRLALRSAAGLNVIGKVDGRASVRRPIAEAQPEIVLVDEMQSSENALERIRECREEAPLSVILLLTMRMEDEWVSKALAAGCDACLSKSAHLPSLGTLIREIVARNIVTALPATLAEGKLPLAAGDELTAREREILGLVSDGLTNARIGRELWVTEQTVKFHLSNIYRKLGVSNRTQASRYAYTHGMLRRGAARGAVASEAELASISELRPVTHADAA
jgi:DNA-binding NarL/FixJ family response regulator